MTGKELILIAMLKRIPDQNGKAVLLQSFIAEEGPLSEEAATKIRKLLK